MSSHTRARLEVLAAAALFSTGGAAVKATALSGWQVTCLRSAFAALSVLVLVPAARKGWSWRTLVVGVTYAATLTLFVVANKLTTSANTIFLQSTAPLYLLLLGPWLLKERIHRSDLGFMAAVAIGMACFFIGTEPPVETAPDPARGNLLATIAGLTWAVTILGLRWLGAHGPRQGGSGGSVAAVVAGNLIAALFTLPMALPFTGASPADWATVTYLGVVQIGIAYVLLTAGIRHVSAFEASILLLCEPVLNPVWSYLLHGEKPGAWAIGGGVLIMTATLIRTLRTARQAPTRPLPDGG